MYGLSPLIMSKIFETKDDNRYGSRFPFKTRNIKTVKWGSECISYLGPKIWEIVPNTIKDSKTLIEFKHKIKRWLPKKCPCRLCKLYIQGVGFLD